MTALGTIHHRQGTGWIRVPAITLALLIGYGLCGQDARFHQLSTSPMLDNPAMTGVMEGRLRLTAHHREVFTTLAASAAYRSVAAAGELRLPIGRARDFAGVGLQLQHDRTAEGRFVRSQVLLSGSYQRLIAGGGRGANRRAHYLSGGAQVGVGQRGVDFGDLWFSSQYFVDPASRQAYLDRSLSSGEPGGSGGTTYYPDVSVGLLYYATLGERKGAYLGGALYHLNEPRVAPVGSSDPLHLRYVVHGGGELPLGRRYASLLPAFRVTTQGPSWSAIAGASFRYTERNWDEIALRIGGYLQMTRQEEADFGASTAVVLVALETNRLQFGISYDLQIGDLSRATNTRGGYELSVTYTIGNQNRRVVVCPRF